MVGFVFVDDLLKLRQFKHYSEDEVQRVVRDNDKQRFSLRNDPSTNRLQVRANQGHSMQVCNDNFPHSASWCQIGV